MKHTTVVLAAMSFVVAASAVASRAGESSDSPVFPKLEAMECFIGQWEATTTLPAGTASSKELGETAGKQLMLTFSVSWSPGKGSQIVHVKHEIKDVVVIHASSVRGWDQTTKKIREYVFTTHKGVWSGSWRKDGNTWVHEYKGTDLDGQECTGTRLYTFTDKDHFVLKAVKQTEAGKPQPDMHFEVKRKGK